MATPQFEFHKLDVYQTALQLRPRITAIARGLTRGYGDLRSQLLRAERSIRLNIAEGAGLNSPGGKVERYRTARGSANECAACLDEVEIDELAPSSVIEETAVLLPRIVSMLTRMVLRWEASKSP